MSHQEIPPGQDSEEEGPCVPMARKCAPHSPRTTMKMGSLMELSADFQIVTSIFYIDR